MHSLKEFLLEKGYSKVKLKLTKTNHFEIKATINGKKGLFKSPDLSITNLDLSVRVIWIKEGKGVMPAYAGKLSEEEIKAVAAYLDELK